MRKIAAVVLLLAGWVQGAVPTSQIAVPKIEKMPNMPQPYALRDWKQVARDYDRLIFDFDRKGDYLPAIWWDKRHINNKRDTFGLPAYIGNAPGRHDEGSADVITSMGAVLGATLVGIDKSNQDGKNWVAMCEGFYSSANGQNLYLNNVTAETGTTFWYDLLPSLIFYHLYYHYPNTGEMEKQFRTTADLWREACIGMGAKANPWTPPNFDHTGYNVKTGKILDNPLWREPDAAGGVAWLEYLAYVKTGEKKYLEAAEWAMGFLDQREKNCFYEVILPYGIYASARMNAELNQNHDTDKLLNWVLNGDNPRGWGVSLGRWGKYDCSGLLSSVAENQGYAFPMDTYIAAGIVTPMVCYDDRYARAIGKWMLNLVNSSRLWYANGLPPDHQTDYAWAVKNDPTYCITYEGLRQFGHRRDRVKRDVKTIAGEIRSGTFQGTIFKDGKTQVLAEKDGKLEHVWEMNLSPGSSHVPVVWGNTGGAGQKFRFSYATKPNGPWTKMFTIESEKETHSWWNLQKLSGTIYLKVQSEREGPGSGPAWQITIDDIYCETTLDKSPYAMGDPLYVGWEVTDYALYGASFTGMIGAMVEATNVEGIIQLDCRATEAFPAKGYPTYLYFNPWNAAKDVEIDCGKDAKDLYDTVSNEFVAKGVSGKATFKAPANGAVLLVVCPAGAAVEYQANKTLVGGLIVDYNNGRAPLPSAAKPPPKKDQSVSVRAGRQARGGDRIEISTKPAGGTMLAKVRFGWDEQYLHILAEETAAPPKRKEAAGIEEFNAAPFACDSLGFFFDLDNSNDDGPQGDFNLWLGFSSQKREDLITSRPHSSEQCSQSFLPGSSAVARVNEKGQRAIEAKIAWSDLASAVSADHQPRGGLKDAVKAGLRFGCEILLVENSYEKQSFIGGAILPTGRDANSRDIILE